MEGGQVQNSPPLSILILLNTTIIDHYIWNQKSIGIIIRFQFVKLAAHLPEQYFF